MTAKNHLGEIPLPDGVEVDRPVYCVSDAHGGSSILRAAIDDSLSDPDIGLLAFLGDMADRGTDSIGCVRAILQAVVSGRETVVIAGNHCQMLGGAVIYRDRRAYPFLERYGGDWALDLINAEIQGDDDAAAAISDVRAYLNAARGSFVVENSNGSKVLLTHAVPPNRPLADCTSEDLRWAYPDASKFMRSRSRLMGGAPGVHVHGHFSSENKLANRPLFDRLKAIVANQARLNIDGGMPFSSRLIRAKIYGRTIRLDLYGKGGI